MNEASRSSKDEQDNESLYIMAPSAIQEHANGPLSDLANLKAKIVVDHVELDDSSPEPPVADDFMYDFKYNHALPTTEVLGVEIPLDCDARKEAEGIVALLSDIMGKGDAPAFADLFLEHGVWRDKLTYTGTYRTFNFRSAILRAASDLFPRTKASKFQFLSPSPRVNRPYPDFAQLQFVLSFETDLVTASAVVNSVLTKDGWKIYTMHTVTETLKDFPEVAAPDGHMTGLISWEKQRAKDVDAADPEVLIIGAGQNGLALAARCKVLGLNSLIIEQSDEVGDVWKKRYEYLSLHFPHWADDLPYFAYPKHWPLYTPAQKQGIYMEWYASALELNVWCKSSVTKAHQDAQGNWTVVISKEGKVTRTLHPKQLVMATSLCGVPLTPVVPGMADFEGTIRHSTKHDSSRDFVGKKVCVVGTSSSGFDTAFDCSRRGIDVTLLQRSPTYVMSLTHSVPRILGSYAPDSDGNRPDHEEVDRLFFATPTGPGEELGRRTAKDLEDLDRPLLDALNARGLRTWRGQRGTGNSTLGQTRNGGFYFDAGACEHVINGKIKVEPGYIERFTKDKVILNGGREREFDLVIFATGFSNTIDSVRATLGDDIASRCGDIWGIDEEGETKTAYKESGVPNLWIMAGFLIATRYHSKLLALRFKALKEGIALPPYEK
ncbi:putative indole-3-pyruvate monooxygenase [Paramyrothecium foliicola]|nr:putative indole-3-pyruvate monooxygenase [Paramyrothecium foliicola]